ncbi:MAG: RNA repair domain-containing protein [Methanocellales archaeon]|nr:RNA repair domain-containing protein [Methanocellales archaeon]
MFRSKRPRELLNEIKWRGLDLSRCEIYYVHRGAPNDTKIVRGNEIEEIGHSFFTLKGAMPLLKPLWVKGTKSLGGRGSKEKRSFSSVMIPYHRIFRITYEGRAIYERELRNT